jgi:hypothetical protein
VNKIYKRKFIKGVTAEILRSKKRITAKSGSLEKHFFLVNCHCFLERVDCANAEKRIFPLQ